jgi:hypothetical protein
MAADPGKDGGVIFLMDSSQSQDQEKNYVNRIADLGFDMFQRISRLVPIFILTIVWHYVVLSSGARFGLSLSIRKVVKAHA